MQFEKVDDDYLMYDGGDATATAKDKAAAAKTALGSKDTPASCDSDDTCCKCLPLGMGVLLLGVFVVVNGCLMTLNGLEALFGHGDVIWGIISLAFCVGPLYAAWRFLQWYRD